MGPFAPLPNLEALIMGNTTLVHDYVVDKLCFFLERKLELSKPLSYLRLFNCEVTEEVIAKLQPLVLHVSYNGIGAYAREIFKDGTEEDLGHTLAEATDLRWAAKE